MSRVDQWSLRDLLQGGGVYMVGIKGAGMAALAELLTHKGVRVTGSDSSEVFYTDALLRRFGIPFYERFSASQVPREASLVVYSSAYDPGDHPELLQAKSFGIPCKEYTEVLGELSRLSDAVGIAGVHGKTTTTAIVGVLAKELKLPFSVLVGSMVPALGNCATYVGGESSFIAETCEYRQHFLRFSPDRIVLTSVEADHQDYFPDLASIQAAFRAYLESLPEEGSVIFCSDDPGCLAVVASTKKARADLRWIPYGRSANGPFRTEKIRQKGQSLSFVLKKFPLQRFTLRLPGQHLLLDAAAALTVTMETMERRGETVTPETAQKMATALAGFTGSRRRTEIVGEGNGILIIDDYAHHPTAIAKTLKGLKEFYRKKRLIVDFMPHTYSRTKALLEEFSLSFAEADVVILHKIYPSAREKNGKRYEISGEDLYRKVMLHNKCVHYFPEVFDAYDFCKRLLREGDLFITMGAGNNGNLARRLSVLTLDGSPGDNPPLVS